MDINIEIKDRLGTKKWTLVGSDCSGCISKGQTYETDNGLVFVKKNSSSDALMMFWGEMESLKAMESTKTVRVPKPLCVVPEVSGTGGAIVVEHLEMTRLKQHSGRLGELMAQMHALNANLGKKKAKNESWVGRSGDLEYIQRFGFDITTCCGIIGQNNEWEDNWIEFFARNRLQLQIDLIQTNEGNRELIELWSQLQIKIHKYFTDIKDTIVPALLHGDLWSGNVGQLAEEPVVFDPSSFYGHSEYELSIAKMFGGFNRAFYECYHNIIPKSSGFDRRNNLYQLYHHLNHWNHFGGHYKQQTLSLMKHLLQ